MMSVARVVLIAIVLAVALAVMAGCDECPEGQSPCEDDRGETHCFYDHPCEGVGFSTCPPRVCEEGAANECPNLETSEAHCGGCGIECPPGTQCLNFVCGAPRE